VDTTISLDANAGEDVWFDVLKDGDGSFSESENGLLTQTIPAGQQTYLRVNGDGAYELSLDFSSRPDPSALLPPRDGGELEVALRLEDQEAAAFWHQGQRLTGTIDVTNHGSSAITAELTAAADAAGVRFQLPGDASVPAGGSLSLPVTVELPADVSDQAPVALQVAASGGSSLAVGGYDLPLRCEAPPVKPFAYSAIPPSLLGRPNVLFAGLGAAVPDGFETQRRDGFINDGRTTVARGAWAGDGHSPTFRLAGDGPVTLLGTVINPASDSETERQLRTFRIETSLDGVGYQTAFEGRLSGARVDQAFVFDAPIEARFARLVAVDSQRGDAEGFFGEWKLIADEPALISGLDLSTPELGGHLVWSRPPLGEGASVDILTETAGLIDRKRTRLNSSH